MKLAQHRLNLGPKMAPRWKGGGPTNDGFWCYVGSWGPNGPRWPQEPPRALQDAILGPSWCHLGAILGQFWVQKRAIQGPTGMFFFAKRGGGVGRSPLGYQYFNISIYQCINISIYQCIYISIHQYINISMYQYINISIYQYIHLSIRQPLQSVGRARRGNKQTSHKQTNNEQRDTSHGPP